ncbi:MAG: hypothetical protein GKR98_03165 [Boseongicola sp.]|nr:MAG: hypothetical protein GKR98_03165 [Boseongicola sp.]
MSILKKLFGGGASSTPEAKPETHNGFTITPEPMKESGGYRLNARIEKEIDGEIKTHQVIRADVLDSPDKAAEIAILKAKQIIDEQGDRLFG